MLLNSLRYRGMVMFVDIPRLQEGNCLLGWCICAVRVWPENIAWQAPHHSSETTPGTQRPFSDQFCSCCSVVPTCLICDIYIYFFFFVNKSVTCISIHHRTQFNITYLRHPNTSWQDTNGFPKHTCLKQHFSPQEVIMAGFLGNICHCVTPVCNLLASSGLPRDGYGFYTAITIRWADIRWPEPGKSLFTEEFPGSVDVKLSCVLDQVVLLFPKYFK